jgi:threonine synthase
MHYCSTRGENRLYSAAEVILMGLAPDGGLFVPADPLPPVVLEELIILRRGDQVVSAESL